MYEFSTRLFTASSSIITPMPELLEITLTSATVVPSSEALIVPPIVLAVESSIAMPLPWLGKAWVPLTLVPT